MCLMHRGVHQKASKTNHRGAVRAEDIDIEERVDSVDSSKRDGRITTPSPLPLPISPVISPKRHPPSP